MRWRQDSSSEHEFVHVLVPRYQNFLFLFFHRHRILGGIDLVVLRKEGRRKERKGVVMEKVQEID